MKTLLPLFSALVLLSGCMSMVNLNDPVPLEPGQVQLAISSTIHPEFIAPEAGVRVGIISDLDMGLKYMFPSGFATDAKYRLIDSKVDLTADVMYSYFTDGKNYRMHGFYPSLLAGGDLIYGGVRGMFFVSRGTIDLFGSEESLEADGYFGTGLFLGARVGKNTFRLLPEINLLIRGHDGEVVMLPALSFSVVF
ncbi:MAG: hypothetical protein HUU10_12325 [Bacteroidetes bacterium]|nr:hypothetical protein [Bacteroidota bacterium]